jgi:glycerophosphoryl diester phosphodiesterase
LYLTARLRFNWALNLLARSVQALQIPVNAGRLRFDSPWFIAAMKSARVEVHYWTINDVEQMRRLIALGADGIVTDRADFAVNTLRT